MDELRKRLERFLDENDRQCCDDTINQRVEELTELRNDSSLAENDNTVDIFAALANETRYELLRLFVVAPRDLCVCEFAPLFDVSDSTVSQGLSTLVDAGLLYRESSGRWRLYNATDRGEQIIEFVDSLDAEAPTAKP